MPMNDSASGFYIVLNACQINGLEKLLVLFNLILFFSIFWLKDEKSGKVRFCYCYVLRA